MVLNYYTLPTMQIVFLLKELVLVEQCAVGRKKYFIVTT